MLIKEVEATRTLQSALAPHMKISTVVSAISYLITLITLITLIALITLITLNISPLT